MTLKHYTDYGGIDASILGFCEVCREHGLKIGLSHSKEALRAAGYGFIHDTKSLKYALRALFCTCEEEHLAFDQLFNIYWRKKRHEYAPNVSKKNRTNLTKKSKSSIVMMGFGDKDEQEHTEAKSVSGANKMEALRKTDFSKVADIDHQLLDQLADRLLEQLNHRLKRRLQSAKKGKIDLRKTIRKNVSRGDTLIQLLKKHRKFEKYRLVILLDVSGSMDKYSFYLLKFIWALKSNFKDIEAFIFSTKLVRITEYIDKAQINQAMMQMGDHANNWSGGTTIGKCLAEFNDLYAKRVLNGRSITILLSDGLDTGEPTLLAAQLSKIKLRTNKVVWLNPLKGMEGYKPLAKGMRAAIPEIDTFESAHNLESLMELEKHLAHV